MQKEKYLQELIKFIQKGTCTFTVMEEIKKELNKNGFQELKMNFVISLLPIYSKCFNDKVGFKAGLSIIA